MEGISGLVRWADVVTRGIDFGRNRRFLTLDVNAAIEVELRNPIEDTLRENLARLPEFELDGDRCVRTLAADMDLGFRRIAYLGYGHAAGVLRY